MDIKLKESIIQNLKDAGCDCTTVDKFKDYYENGNHSNQLLLLKCQRCKLLEKMHAIQKKIDCLDYLIFTLKKEHMEHGK